MPALRTLYLYLTAGCNLACRHCWISPSYQPGGGSGGHLDLALLEQAILEAKPLGLECAKLTGGEPTLHPGFHELCEMLHRHGIRFLMETNGVLLGPREVATARRCGMTFCSVSLDGATAATHDAERGVAGAFDKALAGIACLVAEGFRPQVIFTVNRDNLGELFDLVRLAARLGCGSVKVNLLEPTGRGERLSAFRGLSAAEMLDLGARVEAFQAEAGIPLHYSWPAAFWPLRRLLRGDAGTCGVRTILGVLADGSLAMCGIGRHVPELVYGRIGVTPIGEVWREHPRLRELRAIRPSDLEGVCGRCLHGATCFGCCRANAFGATRSLRAPLDFCQQAWELGRFPATRLRPPRKRDERREPCLATT